MARKPSSEDHDRVRRYLRTGQHEPLKSKPQTESKPKTASTTHSPKTATSSGSPPAKAGGKSTATSSGSGKAMARRGSRAVANPSGGPKLTTTAERGRAMSGFGQKAASAAGRWGLGLGASLMTHSSDAGKGSDAPRGDFKGQAQLLAHQDPNGGVGSPRGVKMGGREGDVPQVATPQPKKPKTYRRKGSPSHQERIDARADRMEARNKPKPKTKTKTKTPSTTSKSTRPSTKETAADRKAERRAKAIVSGTKSANKMANAKFDRVKKRAKKRTSNADKSRKLWLGHSF